MARWFEVAMLAQRARENLGKEEGEPNGNPLRSASILLFADAIFYSIYGP